MDRLLLGFLIVVFISTTCIKAQQNYSANSVMNCDESDASAPSPAFLYTCNGKYRSCEAFLIYKSQHRYNTIYKISKLTSSDPSRTSHINNITIFETLPADKEVIIPVDCSCSGQYYQANTTYSITGIHDNYFSIANNTYEGLSTCNSLISENNYSANSLDVGMELRVPLRCACPTKEQASNGTKYLLTYSVNWGDTVPEISKRFNASFESVSFANGFNHGDYEYVVIFPFTTILVPLSAEPLPSQTIIHYAPPPYSSPFVPTHITIKRSSKGFLGWIILGLGSSLLVLVLVLLLYKKKMFFRSRKRGDEKKKSVLPLGFRDSVAKVETGLKIYTFQELKAATDDFSSENMLSYSVYRGTIEGQMVAIKKMNKEVSNEVNLLRKINHFNLISLYAACEHQGDCYLIYEFMENNSLRDWLQKRSCLEFQSWNRRVQIALDVANGLHYLHNFTDPPYVHKDITSSNILLSRHLRAKIANFSLARSAEAEEYVNSSMRLSLGSKGYMAPEYLESGLVIPEIDTYAFGVVLLELITGKAAVFQQNERQMQLSEVIVSIMEAADAKVKLPSVIDPILQPNNWMEIVLRLVKLSLACLAQEPEERINMAEIVSTLLKIQLDVQISESSFLD